MSQTPKKKSEDKIQNEPLSKDVKKKMAATNEKEKLAAKEEKAADKKENAKTEKVAEKKDNAKTEKVAEKKDNAKTEKVAEKKDKSETRDKKDSGKPESKKPETKTAEPKKPESKSVDTKKPDAKANGDGKKPNGDDKKSNSDKKTEPKTNGAPTNGQSSNGLYSDNEDSLVMDDELFPELVYEESDQELPEAERSVTRRDQVKQTRTPETPKPAEKSTDVTIDLTEDISKSKENGDNNIEVQAVIETTPQDTESRKTDTNFSKSRVKVSPYRRSIRLADQTTSSIAANYTGNNTTMETDIDTSIDSQSIIEDQSITESSSFIQGIRNIRGRKSYKQLKDINMKAIMLNRSLREAAKLANTSSTPETTRPTAPVVGRKRKPESEIEMATEATETDVKRMRLIDRVSHFVARRPVALSPIVGVNSDLPQSAPVAASTSDTETLKPQTDEPIREGKRCVIM